MKLNPRLGIYGTATLLLFTSGAMLESRARADLDVGFEWTLNSGWTFGFLAAGLLTFLWGRWPQNQFFYLSSILVATVSIWSRAVAITVDGGNLVGLLAWMMIFWLMLNLWPRWKVQTYLEDSNGVR